MKQISFTIANGQTDSEVVDLENFAYFAILFPSAMTGTGLSSLKASTTKTGTFKTVQNWTAIAKQDDQWVGITGDNAQILSGLRYVKFGSSGAEGAERTFTLYMN